MLTEEIKKKVLELYELMGLDTDDMTEDEIARVARHYHDNPGKLEKDIKGLDKDLLNIKDKRENGS